MICTFFGHRDTPDEIRKALTETIKKLTTEEDELLFYVGNNGKFDYLVQIVLSEIKKEDKSIDYCVVLSYLGEHALSNQQENTIFPEGLENVPPRFAISKRNEWMLKNSDCVITYTAHKFSNSYKLIQKALKRGLRVINLAEK